MDRALEGRPHPTTPAEIAAVRKHAIRMFCLTNANLTGRQQAERFVTNIEAMVHRSTIPGPWVHGVYENGIRALRLPEAR